ncbi:hypothetical protein D3H65_06585 [Paraflavitalea soli]|uniref:Uncharacterized protein n=1 Tax=Paraflavitalea soli TaxID=2315862 RepID=A0A3B7MT43_9BACT|nr:hypothetical protein D3H65_06585 [Paraflavitalea soli]
MSTGFRFFVENYKSMKIKGRYEVEFDRKDWWCIIVLFVLVAGIIVGNTAVNDFLKDLFKR